MTGVDHCFLLTCLVIYAFIGLFIYVFLFYFSIFISGWDNMNHVILTLLARQQLMFPSECPAELAIVS